MAAPPNPLLNADTSMGPDVASHEVIRGNVDACATLAAAAVR